MVNHYLNTAKKAAQYKIALDVHEPVVPTGLRRTYPNLLSAEGARGQEFNAWATDGGNPPNHNPTLAFTRLLAGPMDFTPGAVAPEWFHDKFQVDGTAAHQLAMYVIYESPLQMLVDYPAAYENNKEALSFLEVVPTVWDETRLLDGIVGDYVVMARRSGDNWFIGAMTDEETRQLNVTLDF